MIPTTVHNKGNCANLRATFLYNKNRIYSGPRCYHQRFFQTCLLELNLYQTYTTATGDVWQYELPPFDNFNFDLPVTSTRLMLDIKPHLLTWHHITYPQCTILGAI